MAHGIGSEAALCVAEVQSGFHLQPKVGKLPSEAAAAGHIFTSHVALTDNDGVRGFRDDRQKCAKIAWIMLPVTIDGNHRDTATLLDGPGRREDRLPLAPVGFVRDDFYSCVSHQLRNARIMASVIDDEHIGDDFPAFESNSSNGSRVVVNGNRHPNVLRGIGLAHGVDANVGSPARAAIKSESLGYSPE